METDAEKLQKGTQKLIDLEVSHQLDRFGGNSKLLREHLATRQLQWSDELHTVTCEGHFIRQPVSEYIEMLRALEPTHFTYEKMVPLTHLFLK